MSTKKKTKPLRRKSVNSNNRNNQSAVDTISRFRKISRDNLEELLKPTKDTIVFKGMNCKIANAFFSAKPETEGTVRLCVGDFYLKTTTENGTPVEIRLLPSFPSFDDSDFMPAVRAALRRKVGDNKKTIIVEIADKKIEILGYIIVKYLDHYTTSICASLGDDEFYFCDIDNYDSYDLAKRQNRLYTRFFQGPNRSSVGEFYQVHNTTTEIADATTDAYWGLSAAMHIVWLYLNGEEIPSLALDSARITPKDDFHPESCGYHEAKIENKSENKAAENAVAYIYFDAIDGTLTISGNHKYHLKWWIVRGHDRHYASGKISTVEPYIKGDKDDPDAQRALEVFKESKKRIRCFKLIARN